MRPEARISSIATAGEDGRDEGGEHGLLPGEDADRDPGEGHVPHPVADEGHPALHEEDPDERRGQAGQQGGDAGPAA